VVLTEFARLENVFATPDSLADPAMKWLTPAKELTVTMVCANLEDVFATADGLELFVTNKLCQLIHAKEKIVEMDHAKMENAFAIVAGVVKPVTFRLTLA
jgi:hypothetical protein